MQTATWGGRCPACEKRFDRRLPWLTDPARRALLAVAVVIGAGTIAVVAPQITQSKKDRAAIDARTQAARVVKERARLIREQRPVRGGVVTKDDPSLRGPERLEVRRGLVLAFQGAILEEVRAREATEELTGTPVREVLCSPLVANKGKARDEDLLDKETGRYDCVAVQRDIVRGGKVLGQLGHSFVGAIRFRKGTWTLCKDNKAPGERGKPLATVVLAPECIGAEGADRLGNGYVDPDSPVPTPEATPDV